MEKKYTQKEFESALSKGIASATGRREEQFKKRLNDLGFESEEQLIDLKNNFDIITGERDQFKSKIEAIETEKQLNAKRQQFKEVGIDERFVDFVMNEVQDGDLDEYITNNPQYLTETFTNTNSDGGYNGVGKRTIENAQSDEEYLKLRREGK
jgi:hypothetical protein